MPVNITMPALSPTMEEGNLAKWLVKEGEEIAPGDVIAEIETDKATMEVEAVDEGKVAKILVPAGTQGVKVNAIIAIIAEDGEEVSDIASLADEAPSQPEASSPSPTKAAPPSQRLAASQVTLTAPQSSTASDRIFSSPLARRIAKDAGLDISTISGSGPRGRIIKKDVEAAIASGHVSNSQIAEQASSAIPSMSDEQVLQLFGEGSYELVKHDGMRKTIARRLTQAKQTIPHFYVSIDCELDELLKLRSQINQAAPLNEDKPAYKLSVNDMIIKALALSLRDVPDANVSWTEENLVRHKHSDVGVAVSIPGGLITPIIRNAEEKSLSVISNEMKDMGARAKERKLKPEEYQGGTTAVSNMGMMGVSNFSAVVNPPQATILAVGAGQKRAIIKDDSIHIATMMTVTLSTDHRCVDGALAANLLAAFKTYIENPVSMLV